MAESKNSRPLDPATIDDTVLRGVAERFVAGDIVKRENRGKTFRYEFDGVRDYTAPDGRRMRSAKHRNGSGVKRRGRRTR